MSGRSKAPERDNVTVRMTTQQLVDLDAEIGALIGGIPGAKLSRGAFCEQIVLAELARRKAARQPEGVTTPQVPTSATSSRAKKSAA